MPLEGTLQTAGPRSEVARNVGAVVDRSALVAQVTGVPVRRTVKVGAVVDRMEALCGYLHVRNTELYDGLVNLLEQKRPAVHGKTSRHVDIPQPAVSSESPEPIVDPPTPAEIYAASMSTSRGASASPAKTKYTADVPNRAEALRRKIDADARASMAPFPGSDGGGGGGGADERARCASDGEPDEPSSRHSESVAGTHTSMELLTPAVPATPQSDADAAERKPCTPRRDAGTPKTPKASGKRSARRSTSRKSSTRKGSTRKGSAKKR
eukprot:TRINITY_DN2995_c0_g1_i1.p1 TRINITY_DN2995_c0_g1~~TRINITY_DN2995_c0_g1_i1.p1  ORF type:complete len:267 (+),score=56.44 TRINITY_DN2995_c0_g1_i1:64-864(+)